MFHSISLLKPAANHAHTHNIFGRTRSNTYLDGSVDHLNAFIEREMLPYICVVGVHLHGRVRIRASSIVVTTVTAMVESFEAAVILLPSFREPHSAGVFMDLCPDAVLSRGNDNGEALQATLFAPSM